MFSKNILIKGVPKIFSKFGKRFNINTRFCKNVIRGFSGNLTSVPSTELGNNININLAANTDGNRTIFFDLQSTTPVDPRVLDAMLPYLTVRYGNPHSNSHEYGWEADNAVEKAREVIF